MKIRTAIRNYYILTKIIKLKKSLMLVDAEQLDCLCIVGGSIKLYNHFGKQAASYKVKHRLIPMIQQFNFYLLTQKKWKHISTK